MNQHIATTDIASIATGLEAGHRQQVAEGLGRLLADLVTLQVKTQNFHWNVSGPNFAALHALFEAQYQELSDAVDSVAERIRALGAPAPGGLAVFAELRTLRDADGGETGGSNGASRAETMVQALRADHESVTRGIRSLLEQAQEAGDEATADLLAGRLGAHEKHAWMLRASSVA